MHRLGCITVFLSLIHMAEKCKSKGVKNGKHKTNEVVSFKSTSVYKQIPKKLRHGFSWNEQQEKNLSLKWVGQGWTGAGYLGFFLPPWGG